MPHRLIRSVEREMSKIGKEQSKPIKARIIEIIEALNAIPSIKIEHLVMGMGGWVFRGEAEAVFSDDSVGKVDVDDVISEWANGSSKVWTPLGFTAAHGRLCKELNELLEFLTENPYMDIFDYKCR